MSDPKIPPKTKEQSEEAWEEEIVGDVLKPDGRIDFDKLRATGLTMTLDELHPAGGENDEA